MKDPLPIPLPESEDPIAMMEEVGVAIQDALGIVVNVKNLKNVTIAKAPVNPSRLKQLYRTSDIAKGMVEVMAQQVEDKDDFYIKLGLK